MNIRQANRSDIDDLVRISLSIAHQEPHWDYCYPRRHQYPHDTAYWTRRRFEAYFDDDTVDFVIMVVTVPGQRSNSSINTSNSIGSDSNQTSTSINVPVSLAVWNLTNVTRKDAHNDKDLKAGNVKGIIVALSSPHEHLRDIIAIAPVFTTSPSEGACCRRDGNVARMKAFRSTITEARNRFFENVYGTKRIHLHILATHPDYQRRGCATRLIRWGFDLAEQHAYVVTIFGSPMGKVLYKSLGFEHKGDLTVQVEGDDASMDLVAMVWQSSSYQDIASQP